MSIRVLIAGYCLSLFATVIGSIAIVRGRHAGRSLWWMVGTFSSALTGALLFSGISFLPLFFTIVLANAAELIAFALLHQAVALVLKSQHRYIRLSVLLVVAQIVFACYFTYISPDIRARILVRTVAFMVQATATVVVLFRAEDAELRSSIRAAGWVLASFVVLQASRVVATVFWWTPVPNRLHPGPVQAFYYLFSFIFGLGSGLAVVWIMLCAQRRDLQWMATTDPLSGLMNRRAFGERLARELRRGKHDGQPVALLMIDLDHFKQINDRHGHLVGDDVIRRVGRLLSINTRAADAVARYGGEEFVMILPGMTLEQARLIAERLRIQIQAMAGLPDEVRATASIGIAARMKGDTVESLLRRSDEALYSSKRAGRNRVCVQAAEATIPLLG